MPGWPSAPRFGVTAEWDFETLEPTEPSYEMHALYAWMTELLGALLAASDGWS